MRARPFTHQIDPSSCDDNPTFVVESRSPGLGSSSIAGSRLAVVAADRFGHERVVAAQGGLSVAGAVWTLARYLIGLAVLVPFLVLSQTEPIFEEFGSQAALMVGLSLLTIVVPMVRAARNLAEVLAARGR